MSKAIVITLFSLAGLALITVGVLSRRESARVPTLGDMSAFVMEYRVGRIPVGRIAVLGFWWWAGWHFFAR